MHLRNIFIVGAAKSGTTTLYYLLSQHPELCTPIVKEPNYFSNIDNESDIVKPGNGPGDDSTVWTDSLQSYDDLYPIKDQHKVKLDASVSYLYSSTAAAQISEYDPDAKIIIVLRNPVERAFSHYKHLLRDGRETKSFENALALENERIRNGWEFSWHLAHMGMYNSQIQRFFQHFDREQIRIFLLEDLKKDIASTIQEITRFIRLNDYDYNFDQKEHNTSGVARSWMLSRFMNWVAGYKAAINNIIPPRITHKTLQLFRKVNIRESELEMPAPICTKLTEKFADDIKKTGQLIGRDLSAWTNK